MRARRPTAYRKTSNSFTIHQSKTSTTMKNIHERLRLAETGLLSPAFRTFCARKLPHRLCVPLSQMDGPIHAAPDGQRTDVQLNNISASGTRSLRECVVLGFDYSGAFVMSYAVEHLNASSLYNYSGTGSSDGNGNRENGHADGDNFALGVRYWLQFWSFRMGAPLRLCYEIPLFDSYGEIQGEDGSNPPVHANSTLVSPSSVQVPSEGASNSGSGRVGGTSSSNNDDGRVLLPDHPIAPSELPGGYPHRAFRDDRCNTSLGSDVCSLLSERGVEQIDTESAKESANTAARDKAAWARQASLCVRTIDAQLGLRLEVCQTPDRRWFLVHATEAVDADIQMPSTTHGGSSEVTNQKHYFAIVLAPWLCPSLGQCSQLDERDSPFVWRQRAPRTIIKNCRAAFEIEFTVPRPAFSWHESLIGSNRLVICSGDALHVFSWRCVCRHTMAVRETADQHCNTHLFHPWTDRWGACLPLIDGFATGNLDGTTVELRRLGEFPVEAYVRHVLRQRRLSAVFPATLLDYHCDLIEVSCQSAVLFITCWMGDSSAALSTLFYSLVARVDLQTGKAVSLGTFGPLQPARHIQSQFQSRPSFELLLTADASFGRQRLRQWRRKIMHPRECAMKLCPALAREQEGLHHQFNATALGHWSNDSVFSGRSLPFILHPHFPFAIISSSTL